MQLPSVRMTTHLNALIHHQVSVELASKAIIGADVAHHVVDPDSLLGLDPLQATPLDIALAQLLRIERTTWVMALPQPGKLSPLRGPQLFNQAALDVGESVVGNLCGLALVPYRVGQAVQWRVFVASQPLPPVAPADADRELSEAVLAAAQTLTQLDVPAGAWPAMGSDTTLAPGYGARQRSTADRAIRLLVACNAALADDGGTISSYEAGIRTKELRNVRNAATQALCSACSWIELPR